MNEWILFTIGMFIGSMVGIMTMAILSARRYDNMSREIQDLRTQRKLLKDELLKGQPKPKGIKIPKTERFPGQAYRLPDEPGFIPFSGQAQRLPAENTLRANAIQRMRELGHQGMQARRGREMVDRMGDLGRALRRGGQRGDVVVAGKRKREEEFTPNPRPAMRLLGDRPVGPQQFSIAT